MPHSHLDSQASTLAHSQTCLGVSPDDFPLTLPLAAFPPSIHIPSTSGPKPRVPKPRSVRPTGGQPADPGCPNPSVTADWQHTSSRPKRPGGQPRFAPKGAPRPGGPRRSAPALARIFFFSALLSICFRDPAPGPSDQTTWRAGFLRCTKNRT